VTSFDENYYEYSMVAVKSFGMNYHGKDILDVICLVPPEILGKGEDYSERINQKNLNIIFKTSNSYLKLRQDRLSHPYHNTGDNCNHRIFLGSTCLEYDVAVYIDPDTITLRNVDNLINYPLRNKLSALVEYTDVNRISFNDQDRPYFNNGVFVADLGWWRDSLAEEKMVEWIKENGPTTFPDQDSMNAVFIDDWAPLPITMNYFNYRLWVDSLIDEMIPEPMVVHFAGEEKPWRDMPNTKYGEAWRTFYNKWIKAT
jgi:lipopolysaccharide biosynthesis glycosyltransferase